MPTATSYIAKPILKIDGQDASADLLEDILQISVEESLHLPGMFTLVIKNDYFPGRDEDEAWKHESLFEIGKTIEIGFISSATESDDYDEADQGNVLKGEITAIETHFTSGSQAPLIIRGYDASHRLHRGRYNRSFQNKTDTDIVNQIAGEVGIATGTIDSTGGPYGYGDIGGASGYVFQENQTNMEFLRDRAARNGYELFVQDGKLNFRKPQKGSTVSLEWLKDLHSFRVRVTSAEQVSSVEVRGWDYSKKEAISEVISSPDTVFTTTETGTGRSTSSSFQGKPTSPKLIVVDRPVSQSTEAKAIATALCNELGGEFVHADARSEGNPLIRPGKLVELANMGKYSGTYYVTETRHLFHERHYITEFSVRGLRGGDLLQTLSPPTQLHPGQTCMIGIVADNNDPKGWGRVRVKFPTLTEEHMSNWARVVNMGAGSSRGFDCLPEINDEVLVAFEHGDIHRPFVIGGVWNGKDATPEAVADSVVGGKVRLRTFKTRTGHILRFVEEDKDSIKKGVYTQTVYGHQLSLNDTEKYAELKTKEGHFLKLDDQNKKIQIKTQGGHEFLLDDNGSTCDWTSQGKINVKSGGSGTSNNININGGNITIEATTNITLKVGSNKIVISNSGVEITGLQVKAKATGTANFEGAIVTVQASGITNVKGSLVKIN
ncbi:MAG: VgrG-related protein [Thainema sp.]